MKKTLVFLAIILFAISCEKSFDEVVDPSDEIAQTPRIVNVVAPDSFFVSQTNTNLITKVDVKNTNSSTEVYVRLSNEFGAYLDITLHESGNENGIITFEGTFTVDTTYHNGFYSLEFFVKANGNTNLGAIHTVYIVGRNYPPRLDNLVFPDTVSIGETFIFHVEASDPDGANDLAGVYYNAYDPNGNLVINNDGISDFPMSDNGDTQISGDEVADDQIYTMKLTFPENTPTGAWRFDFYAIDRARAKSEIISHTFTVMQ